MNDQLMLEYIFFHEKPYEKFIQFLRSKKVDPLREGLDETDVEGRVVFIQDNLEEALSQEIEAFYDEMMDLNEALIAEQDDSDETNNVGLAVSLSDGRSVLATVDPNVLNKILSVITHQQLGEMVDAIADAVENPDERPLCKR
jgi:hypothetical protein